MARLLLILSLLGSGAVAATAPNAGKLQPTPVALQLLERDWVLMNWALKFYDQNRDILLQPQEAAAACEAFRSMADADNDGRVTPQEYQAARAFILAQH